MKESGQIMLKTFLKAETGAVTVDWTILTAVLCGLAFAATMAVSIGAREPTNALNSTLASDVVGDHTSFD